MATISQVWDNVHVKLTFRRNFNNEMMEQWFALEEICKSIVFSSDCDSLIWTYTADGQYSTTTLLALEGLPPFIFPLFGLLWFLPECISFFGC
jgi:hypothetical protein